MSKVKILIVEDEIVIADNICSTLQKLGYEVLEPAINYSEAIELIESESPDLALLDIQLAGNRDGIDLAWKIKEDYTFPFIFLTSNADPRTIDRAKDLNPPAYLVKPFNKDDLYTSIELALHNYDKSTTERNGNENQKVVFKDAIFVKEKNLFHKVTFEEILYAKSDHVYIEIFTKSGRKHLIRNTMGDFEESLPNYFFRSHRSYIVNLNHLNAINSRFVLINGAEIPIGKNNREELMRQINIR